MSIPVVALVGRPNVGKSHLFNRIVGDQHGHRVAKRPGTTRDRHFARAEWNGRAVLAGRHGRAHRRPAHADGPRDPPAGGGQAIGEADLLRVPGRRQGRAPPQRRARGRAPARSGKPWMLVANKVDDPRATDFYEFYELGAGEPVPVSALNGKESGDLLDVLVAQLPAARRRTRTARCTWPWSAGPTSGKSSLVNRLLGEERLVVSEERGNDARRDRHADDVSRAYARLHRHGRSPPADQDRGWHRVLLVAAQPAGDRARRHLRARHRRGRRPAQSGPQDRDDGVGRRSRAHHRGQQVGSGREGRQGHRPSSRSRVARRRRTSPSCPSCSRRRSPGSA